MKINSIVVAASWKKMFIFGDTSRETKPEGVFVVERHTLFVDVKLLHENWKLINFKICSVAWGHVCGTHRDSFFCDFVGNVAIFLPLPLVLSAIVTREEFQISSFTCRCFRYNQKLLLHHHHHHSLVQVQVAPKQNCSIKIIQIATQLRLECANK